MNKELKRIAELSGLEVSKEIITENLKRPNYDEYDFKRFKNTFNYLHNAINIIQELYELYDEKPDGQYKDEMVERYVTRAKQELLNAKKLHELNNDINVESLETFIKSLIFYCDGILLDHTERMSRPNPQEFI